MRTQPKAGRRYALPILIAIAAIASVVITTTLAMAHASPERSEPAPNSVLATAPKQVSMWFSEPLEPAFSEIQVLDSGSNRVDTRNSGVDSNDPKRMSVSLPPLPNGTYTVAWKTLSTVDGHGLRGSYVFSVGEAQLGGSSSLDVKAPLLQSPLDPPVRWLVLLAGMAIVGGMVFELVVLGPVLGNNRQSTKLTTSVRRIRRFVIASALLFLIASVMQAAIQAATVSGESLYSFTRLPIKDVILNTEWGQVWLWRIGLLALTFALLMANLKLKGAVSKAARWLALVSSSGMVLALSWVSHGAAVAGLRMQGLFSDYAHLLASAVWIGGLFSFAILIWSIYKRVQVAQRNQILSTIVPRFSVIATLCVGTLIITGVFNSWAQVNSIGAFSTPYGFTLIAKLLLIVPLLALGALNLLWVRRMLGKQEYRSEEASGWLRRFVTGEVALAVLVVLSVGMMLSLQPAIQADAEEQRLAGINRSLTVDATRMDVKLEGGTVGSNRVTVSLRNAIDEPITNATLVSLRFTFLNADVGSVTASARHAGNGVYTADGVVLSIRGAWVGTVRVARPDSLDVIGSIQFSLSEPGADVNSGPSTDTGRILVLLEFLLIGSLFVGVGMVIGGFKTSAGSKITTPGLICMAAGITVFLLTSATATPPQSVPGVPTPSQGGNPIVKGRALFTEHCIVCHGAAGMGDGPLASTLTPPPLNLQVHAPLHPDQQLYRFIASGVFGTAMTNWDKTLTPDEIWDIVFYLRILTEPVNTSDVN